MEKRLTSCETGFTLIEILGVMVVAAIMFAMMFVYFNRALTESARPVVRLGKALALTQVAEKITADYIRDRSVQGIKTIKDTLDDDKTRKTYGDPSDFSVATRFVKFDASRNDTPVSEGDPSDLLKITLTSARTGETLTLLLSAWSSP